MIDRLKLLSKLSRETTGASFDIRHMESGKIKIIFTSKEVSVSVNKSMLEHDIHNMPSMIEEAISYIVARRRKATDHHARKPFTLFKIT